MHYDGNMESTLLNQLTVIKGWIQLNKPEEAVRAVDQLAAFVREGNNEKIQSISVRDDQRLADCVGV